jgi:uncharacterized membrane protein YoaK (UPF0700 family)
LDNRHLIAAGYLLTAVAGWVDAQGFLALHGIFVSFMSGNTTLLGVALAPGNWGQAGSVGLVIGLFFLGGFAGAFLSGATGRWSMPAVAVLEALVLAAALIMSAAFGLSMTAGVMLAFAMGAQNAAATAIGPIRSGVTYVTGSLFSAGQELGRIARGVGSGVVLVGNLSSWGSLLIGVTAGAAADARFGLAALVVPAAALVALAAYSAMMLRRA